MSNQEISWLVLAIRSRQTSEWTLDLALLFRDEIRAAVVDRIRNNAEVRLITRYIHSSGGRYREKDMEHCAFQRGWHRQGKFWVPIEEPLSLRPPEHVKEAEVTFNLKSILFGSIAVEITAGDVHLDLVLDDIRDYPITFVRFVQILTAGGLPHAAMTDETWCDIVINNGPAPDKCRLYINNEYPGREAHIDIFTDRKRLTEAFRKLAFEIGEHPYFAHHFLYHGLPTEEYDRVAETHDQDWAAGTRQGIYPDDCDAEDASLAARIVEQVVLPTAYAEEAARNREMMRSLEIPQDWELKFGLRPIVTDDDVANILEFLVRA